MPDTAPSRRKSKTVTVCLVLLAAFSIPYVSPPEARGQGIAMYSNGPRSPSSGSGSAFPPGSAAGSVMSMTGGSAFGGMSNSGSLGGAGSGSRDGALGVRASAGMSGNASGQSGAAPPGLNAAAKPGSTKRVSSARKPTKSSDVDNPALTSGGPYEPASDAPPGWQTDSIYKSHWTSPANDYQWGASRK